MRWSKLRKYLKQRERETMNKRLVEIENHINSIGLMMREWIDNEQESYVYDYKDYARIDDYLTQIYNEIHYVKEVIK